MSNAHRCLSLTLVALPLWLGACGGASEPGPADANSAKEMPATAWSEVPLLGAVDVRDVRESPTDGASVVLRGTLQDFGALATFRLVEDSLLDCSEQGGDDPCQEPWDYCCEPSDELARLTVNVEFLAGSAPAEWTLRGAHGLERLSEVTVAGTLRVDEAGNLRLEAQRMALQ